MNRERGIVDMQEGAPLVAAEYGDGFIDHGFGGEQVYDKVETGAAGEPINRAKAKDYGAKSVAFHVQQHVLARDFAARIERNRVQRRIFVEVAVAGSVYRATAGEDE